MNLGSDLELTISMNKKLIMASSNGVHLMED